MFSMKSHIARKKIIFPKFVYVNYVRAGTRSSLVKNSKDVFGTCS